MFDMPRPTLKPDYNVVKLPIGEQGNHRCPFIASLTAHFFFLSFFFFFFFLFWGPTLLPVAAHLLMYSVTRHSCKAHSHTWYNSNSVIKRSQEEVWQWQQWCPYSILKPAHLWERSGWWGWQGQQGWSGQQGWRQWGLWWNTVCCLGEWSNWLW